MSSVTESLLRFFRWGSASVPETKPQAAITRRSSGLAEFIRGLQQREGIVKDIYNRLIEDNATAIVLTGMIGNGKSILAALICSYAEKQRIDNCHTTTTQS